MLSITCQTAIKAITYIASKYPENKKVGLKEIAIHINESEHTIGKVLQKLSKLSLISSHKGPKGGFFISKTQHNLPLLLIVKAIEGDSYFEMCGLGLSKCSDKHPCPIHKDFKPVRESFRKFCAKMTIGDLYSDLNVGNAFLIG